MFFSNVIFMALFSQAYKLTDISPYINVLYAWPCCSKENLCVFHIYSVCLCVYAYCERMGIFVQVAVMKKSRKQERRRQAEGEKDAMMNEPKEEESCKMAAQIASVAQQQQLTEAHWGFRHRHRL